MRGRRLILRLASLMVLLVLALALNTGRNIAGWVPLSETPEERLAELKPAWRLIRPQIAGPHPVTVLLSGCDGVQDNMDRWARFFVAQGRAVVILDSHQPRALDRHQAWRAVCAGQILTGAERAGDLAVTLAALDRIEGFAGQEVMVLGASHGGWTVMELMAQLAAGGDPPPGLTVWPEPPDRMAARLRDLVLFYPYCGIASRAGAGPWPENIRALMILAEDDRIIDTGACLDMAEGLAELGVPMQVEVLAETDHGFDQRSRSALSPLRFNAGATARAEALIAAFASRARAGL